MEQVFMAQMLRRTPWWVWLIFFILLALGYRHSKERIASPPQLFILPLVMALFGLYGVFVSFGLSAFALCCWAGGFGVPFVRGIAWLTPQGLWYPSVQRIGIPGSWLPLTLMMALFGVKYLLGMLAARHAALLFNPLFVAGASVFLGLCSGMLLARNIGIVRSQHVHRRLAGGHSLKQ